MRRNRIILAIFLLVGLTAGCGTSFNPTSLESRVYALPVQAAPLSFDDFYYDPQTRQVVIPAAETGDLALINPATMKTSLVHGFSRADAEGNPVVGATSATSGEGFIFVLDKAALKVDIVSPASLAIVGSAPVQASGDLVRYVAATHEVWVTEKASEQIEVFSLAKGKSPALSTAGVIAIPNGPEALLIDNTRGVAYTNQSKNGLTAVIDLFSRRIVAQWGNGCSKGRSMALDEARGFLFIACSEGKLVMMDVSNDGVQLASQIYGGGLDFIAYNPALGHIYLPSGKSAVLAIFAVQETLVTPQPTQTGSPGAATPTPSPTDPPGVTPTPNLKIALVRLGTADTAVGAKCVISDNLNNVWLCDPTGGRLILVRDTFPAEGQ